MRCARTIKFRAGGRHHGLSGGALSNIQKLEEDFAKQVTFGKDAPTTTSDAIKKKFSI